MNQKPIYTFAKWQVNEGHLHTVLQLLTEATQKSIQEKGNLFYKVHQSNSDANTLLLFEGYTDESALAEHRNSDHFQTIVIGKIIPMLAAREVIVTTELVMVQQ